MKNGIIHLSFSGPDLQVTNKFGLIFRFNRCFFLNTRACVCVRACVYVCVCVCLCVCVSKRGVYAGV